MKIKAFKGLRPVADKVALIASRPYDVLSTQEARIEAEDNPYSFLNVVKPEITLAPGIDQYDDKVYLAGKKNFQKLIDTGIFIQDQENCIYIYELTMEGRKQTGIVACAAVEDYLNNKIKKHELTRPDKENDRKNHIRVSMVNAEPVFFAYQCNKALDELVLQAKETRPEYEFTATDNIVHKLWVISSPSTIDKIIEKFEEMPATYVADGHHRTAAAAHVGNELKLENPGHTGNEEYNYFLAVHFPDNQLQIIDYNRVVKDLNGHEPGSFLKLLSGAFSIENKGNIPCKPQKLHQMSMYLDGVWYLLTANPGTYDDSDPMAALDVTILSEEILKPILDIHDLRTDSRIEFVGGIRGMEELQQKVDSKQMAVAFAMYPVSMSQLMEIADNDLIMPPKVTWFEPKLRSGLVVHSLEG